MGNLPALKFELPSEAYSIIVDAECLALSINVSAVTVHDEFEASSVNRNLINDTVKLLDKTRKELTAPIDDLKKKVMAQFAEPTQKLEALKLSLESEMMKFKKRLDEERAQQQRELTAKAEAEAAVERNRLLALAEQNIDKGKVELAEALCDMAEEVNAFEPILAPVKIPSQEVATVKRWKYEIVDIHQVPREFLIPNERLLQQVASGSKENANVPGVTFYAEESFSTKRK